MINTGGNANMVKNAVAPPSFKGSFFMNNLKVSVMILLNIGILFAILYYTIFTDNAYFTLSNCCSIFSNASVISFSKPGLVSALVCVAYQIITMAI